MNIYVQRGFTIIELMMTVALMAVMVTLAIPSFGSMVKQNRLSTQTNTILSSINYARSETINQNNDVLIAPITAGTDWSGGWTTSVNGTVLRNFERFENATVTSSVATITYKADGSLDLPAGNNVTLTITPNDCPTGELDRRLITISWSGQSRSAATACP